MPGLMISYGEINELNNFKEYGSVYDFGSYNTRFGTGTKYINPFDGNSTISVGILNSLIDFILL